MSSGFICNKHTTNNSCVFIDQVQNTKLATAMGRITNIAFHNSLNKIGVITPESAIESVKIERENDILFTKAYILGLVNKGLYYDLQTFNSNKSNLPIFQRLDDIIINKQIEDKLHGIDYKNKTNYISFQKDLTTKKCSAIEIIFNGNFMLDLVSETKYVNTLYIVPLPTQGGSLIIQLYKKYCK